MTDLSLKSLSKVHVYTKVANTSLLLQGDDVSNNKPAYRESNNTASVLSWKILPHGFCFFKAWLTALCRSLHVPCTTVSTCQSQFNLSQKLITFQKHLRTALHQSHYNDSCGETGCLQQDDFFLLPLWCYKIVSVLQKFLCCILTLGGTDIDNTATILDFTSAANCFP